LLTGGNHGPTSFDCRMSALVAGGRTGAGACI
jgi:hypothetical protein